MQLFCSRAHQLVAPFVVNPVKAAIPLLSLVLILFICTGCPKEPEPRHIAFTQEELDYGFYKKGSWWIYEDSASGVTNRHMVVKDSFFDFHEYSYKRNVRDKYYGTSERFVFQMLMFNRLVDYEGGVKSLSGGYYIVGGGESQGSVYYLQHYEKGIEVDRVRHFYATLKQTYYDSFFVNNQVFYDVLRVSSTSNDVFPLDPSTVLYLAKNHGIIRWEIYWDKTRYPKVDSSQIWNLVDHQVVQ